MDLDSLEKKNGKEEGRLIYYSKADNYEEVKLEWDYVDFWSDESFDFMENCELCNSPLYRENYLIENSNTGHQLVVGSTCIKKFVQITGSESQEHSNAIFERRTEKIKASRRANQLLPEILGIPTMMQVQEFYNCAKKFFDVNSLKGNTFIPDPKAWNDFLDKIMGKNRKQQDIEKVKYALFKPNKLTIRKLKTEDYKEEKHGWRKQQARVKKGTRQKRVRTTLSKSKDYKNPG